MDTAVVIKEILVDLGIPETSIDGDKHLKRDLQLDSTDTVQVALDIKKKLNVTFKIESSEDLTVAQVCRLVESLKAAATIDK
jgi:acyl carrier protein